MPWEGERLSLQSKGGKTNLLGPFTCCLVFIDPTEPEQGLKELSGADEAAEAWGRCGSALPQARAGKEPGPARQPPTLPCACVSLGHTDSARRGWPRESTQLP